VKTRSENEMSEMEMNVMEMSVMEMNAMDLERKLQRSLRGDRVGDLSDRMGDRLANRTGDRAGDHTGVRTSVRADAGTIAGTGGLMSDHASTRGAAVSRSAAPTWLLHKELSYAIVGAAIEVHRHIGPGQLEATYERALSKELSRREIAHRRQVPLTMFFKGDPVGEYYADMIVDEKIIVELKSVAAIHHMHKMQVLSYLRASGHRLGLLINFNVPVLWRAIARIVL
jgi:GxxExxY protein